MLLRDLRIMFRCVCVGASEPATHDTKRGATHISEGEGMNREVLLADQGDWSTKEPSHI